MSKWKSDQEFVHELMPGTEVDFWDDREGWRPGIVTHVEEKINVEVTDHGDIAPEGGRYTASVSGRATDRAGWTFSISVPHHGPRVARDLIRPKYSPPVITGQLTVERHVYEHLAQQYTRLGRELDEARGRNLNLTAEVSASHNRENAVKHDRNDLQELASSLQKDLDLVIAQRNEAMADRDLLKGQRDNLHAELVERKSKQQVEGIVAVMRDAGLGFPWDPQHENRGEVIERAVKRIAALVVDSVERTKALAERDEARRQAEWGREDYARTAIIILMREAGYTFECKEAEPYVDIRQRAVLLIKRLREDRSKDIAFRNMVTEAIRKL